MEGTGVIDTFLDTFSSYIDSGFGLVAGDVGFLASALIVIDVTLALLFVTWGGHEDIVAKLVKKTLHVGFFAFLITNWNGLAKIVYLSFSGIGLKAAGSGSADDLLHPGRIAQYGIDAARPLLEQASLLVGPVGLFANFVQIAVLLFAWALVLLAFFIIAIQLFVTLVEFKLVTLAGFVLVPFGLFGRTAFLAERVLGNVMATGVKVLVLAVIIGIGSTIFDDFVTSFGGAEPTLEQVASLALAALTLLGLSIFGPGIAAGLVSGGPQLGAGAAIGTGLTVAGMGTAVGMAGASAASLTSRAASATAASFSQPTGPSSPGGRLQSPAPASPAPAGGAPMTPPTGGAPGTGRAPASGAAAGGQAPEPLTQPEAPPHSSGAPSADDGAPAWARRLRRSQAMSQGIGLAAHSLKSGDHGGGAAHISLEDRS